MSEFFGTSAAVTVGVTCLLMGFAAYMTGQSLARTWKPVGIGLFYCVLLAVVDRFLIYALFDGVLLSLSGYLSGLVILTVIYLAAYRISQVKMMVSQYPWLYEPRGMFFWRDIT